MIQTELTELLFWILNVMTKLFRDKNDKTYSQ